MKKTFFILGICLFFFACVNKNNEYYLYNGLVGFHKFRYINKEFVEGYGFKKIAFFQEAEQLQYALLLKDNVTAEMVQNYSLGLRVYANEKYLSEGQSFLMWDTKPQLQKMGEFNYIINGFKEPIREMDSIVFFLYDRGRYQGIKGNVISIKNIEL